MSNLFLEHPIKKVYHSKFNNTENKITIILGEIEEIAKRLNESSNAMDLHELTNKHDLEFLMASTTISKTTTLFIGVSESMTNEKLAILIGRARHYGKYSWLSVSKMGQTHKGTWPIKEKYFEFSHK